MVLQLLVASLLVSVSPGSGGIVQNGDRIVFFGDSITGQRLYTSFIESYLTGRFPEYDLTFVNAGVGGDTVQKALTRVERDVLSVKPTMVIIAFGMNDVVYVQENENLAEWYKKNYIELADRLHAHGARILLLGPNPVDDDYQNLRNQNDLEILTNTLISFAAEHNLTAIDMFHPLRDLLRKAKGAKKEIVLIPDGVHPNPAGHVAMAYVILTSLSAPDMVADIVIDAGTGKIKASGTDVTGLSTQVNVEFSAKDSALPMYMPIEAESALEIIPIPQKINRHMLRISGLPEGKYQLLIDGVPVAKFGGAQLESGVNLSEYPTPAWNQAERLWKLIAAKNDLYHRRLRQILLYVAPDWLPQEMVESRRKQALAAMDAEIKETARRISEEKKPIVHHFVVKQVK